MGIVEIPVFTGSDLRSWLDWMENHFYRCEYNDLEKLWFAHGFIEGEAEAFCRRREALKIFESWKEMRDSLLMIFGDADDSERITLQNEDKQYREQMFARVQNAEIKIQKKTTTNISVKLILEDESGEKVGSFSNSLIQCRVDMELTQTESRISAMDEKLNTTMGRIKNPTLKVKDADLRVVRRPDSLLTQFQVSPSNWEQNEIQLGYRSGRETVAIHDNLIPESDLPKFDGTNSCQVKICSSEEVNIDESNSTVEAVIETEFVRKTISPSGEAISVKLGDCHVQNHSSPEIILESDSLPAHDHEKERMKTEMVQVFDHVNEIYELSLELQGRFVLKKESVVSGFMDLVQQVDSPTVEEVSVSSDLGSAIQCRSIDTLELNDASLELELQTTRVSHSETNCVLQPQRTTEMVKRTESQFVETTSVHYGDCPIQNCFLQEMTFTHGSISAIHQDYGLSSEIAVIDGVVQIDSLLEHESQTLRDANVVRSYHIQVNGLTDVIWLTSERQHLELKRKFNKLWHFKYKPEKVEMKGQHHHVLYLVYLAEHKRDLLRMKGKRTSLRFWLSQLQCVCALVEGLSTMCSIRHILQVMKQFILGNVKFQVKHRWKSKQFGLVSDLVFYVNQIVGRNYSEVSVWGRRLLSRVYPRHLQGLMQLGGLKGQCFLSNEAVVKSVWILNFEGICYTKDYFVRAVRRMICELPARLYNQRLKHSFGEATIQRTSQGEAMVQLQSKEEMRRLWLQLKTKRSGLNLFSLIELQFPVDDSDAVEFLFTRVAGKQSELQTQGSSHASSPIISLSPSLRSSLSSREGVYKRLFTCGLIVEVLIWFFAAINTSNLLKNNVRRQKEKDVQSTHLLHQVLIQQRQKWKKSYKTRMFKYKERTRQVQFSLLHVVCDLWSISCLIWHRWKRKEYHICDSAMVDVLEWLDRGDTSALNQCIYPCGFVWCSHKSVDTSSRAQHVILTKLEGKLVFLGGSIDRHRLSGLLTWIRELREIETLDGLEALQLEESGSARRRKV